MREFIPDDYYVASVQFTESDVIESYSFAMGEYGESGSYHGLPCFQMNYVTGQPGTTTVTLRIEYQYDVPTERGSCSYCRNYVECSANYNHYYDTITFTVTVEGETEPTPVAPSKPSDDTVIALMEHAINIDCTDEEAGHIMVDYNLTEDTFEVGEVYGDANTGYKVDVSVTSETYVTKYNSVMSAAHTPATETKSFTMTYDSDTQTWSGSNVTFYIDCGEETDPTPTAPSDAEVKALLADKIDVHCDTLDSDGDAIHKHKAYGLMENTYSVSKADENTYTVAVNDLGPYCTQYSEDRKAEHTLWTKPPISFTLTWENNAWTCNDQSKNVYVVCPEPEDTYTVIYTDGVEDQEIFADVTYSGLTSGEETPQYNGGQEPTRDGYTFKGWAPAVAQTVTADATYTAQWEANAATPTDPSAPSDTEVKAMLGVKVSCYNSEVEHDEKTYDLEDGTYTVGNVTSVNGSLVADVRITVASYIEKYNTATGAEHTLFAGSPAMSVRLIYNAGTGQWESTYPYLNVPVICTTPEITPTKPAKPTKAEVKELIAGVVIDCINENREHFEKEYGLIDGTYTIDDVEKVEGVYTSYVEIKADKYIEAYNQYKTGHKLAPSNGDTIRIPLEYTEGEDGEWVLPFENADAVWAHFEAICKNGHKHTSDDDLDDVPKTGDQIMTTVGVYAAGIAGLAAVAVILSRKKSFR